MNTRATLERIRDNQFFLPAILIAASVALAVATNQLDGSETPGGWLLVPSSSDAGRVLLATIAGAIITVAALVFSFTAVTVQLAASQYSLRVAQEFVRDRTQQVVAGLLMGTFTFAILSLALIGGPKSDTARADWTASVAVVLGVMSALVIVWYIDRVTRRVRIDDTIRRIVEDTKRSLQAAQPRTASVAESSWNVNPEATSEIVRSDRTGFVQEIDIDQLADSLPGECIARLDVWAGSFVIEGGRLLTIWDGIAAEFDPLVKATFAIGETRTIEQDPGLGFRLLVDIALRALSPGINDPATATEVVNQLAGCLRTAHVAGDPPRVFVGTNGARVIVPRAPTVASLATEAIEPIRRAGSNQPDVLEAVVESLAALSEESIAHDEHFPAIEKQTAAAQARLDELRAEDP